MKTTLSIIFFLVSLYVFSQKENKHIVAGNKLYQEAKYEDAEKAYSKALEINATSYKAKFNQADALFKQEKYKEAAQQFGVLAEQTNDKIQKANAYHNLGNSLLMDQETEGNLEKSVTAYKNALRNNPKDEATRYNLAFAQKLLQQQQQQNQQNKDDKNQENKDKQEDKENQEKQENKENDKKDEQKQQNQQNKDDNKEKQNEQQTPQPNQLSKEDAQRLLDAMQNEERKVHEKANVKKEKTSRVTIEKDW